MTQRVNPDLVQELRRMLLDGATPSRLIRRLLEDDSFKEQPGDALLDEYFSAAFGNKVYRLALLGDAEFSDLRYAGLNAELSHQVLQGQSEWRQDVETPSLCWCDDLEAVDIPVLLHKFDARADSYLRDAWDQFDARTQAYLRHKFASHQVAAEKVRILQMLVERLQQKVAHLERVVAQQELEA